MSWAATKAAHKEQGGIFMKYVYPAIFYNSVGGGYAIEFPDVEGAATQADTLYEAIIMAEDSLSGMMVCYEDYKAGRLDHEIKNRIVEPTPLDKVKPELDEYTTGAIVTLIKADTDEYRKILANMDTEKLTKATAL